MLTARKESLGTAASESLLSFHSTIIGDAWAKLTSPRALVLAALHAELSDLPLVSRARADSIASHLHGKTRWRATRTCVLDVVACSPPVRRSLPPLLRRDGGTGGLEKTVLLGPGWRFAPLWPSEQQSRYGALLLQKDISSVDVEERNPQRPHGASYGVVHGSRDVCPLGAA